MTGAVVTAVLDTHIWLEWLLWRSPRIEPLRAACAAGELRLLYSEAALDEWRRVLGYSQFALALEQIDALCAELCGLAQRTTALDVAVCAALPKCRDVDDQKFLELCVAGDAKLLITRDKKLRKIGRHRYFKTMGLQVVTLEVYLALYAVAGA